MTSPMTTIRLPSQLSRMETQVSPLRLTPFAWKKLQFLRDLGPTEVGGFAISSERDLLLVEDIVLVKQVCTSVSVKFDDQAVADHYDRYVDQRMAIERFARIWVHTHPGTSAQPSSTDEKTFTRCFGAASWALMFILAHGGATYARLRLNSGPGAELVIPVEIDFDVPFPASQESAWEHEYGQSVSHERELVYEEPVVRRGPFADDPYFAGRAADELELLERWERDPFFYEALEMQREWY